MKKLASLMLGLTLILGTTAFAQDAPKADEKKAEKKKGAKKGKKAEKKAEEKK